jgi:hypothetical protein
MHTKMAIKILRTKEDAQQRVLHVSVQGCNERDPQARGNQKKIIAPSLDLGAIIRYRAWMGMLDWACRWFDTRRTICAQETLQCSLFLELK